MPKVSWTRYFIALWLCSMLLAVAFAVEARVMPAWSQTPVPPVFTGLVKGVAVGGFDTVAYHTAGEPVAGDPAISTSYQGATWRFSTAANRDLFLADPERYAPRYGGYCAWAVASGYTAKGDPRAWSIVDGRLYLNYDQSVRRSWEKDAAGSISKADATWPRLVR